MNSGDRDGNAAGDGPGRPLPAGAPCAAAAAGPAEEYDPGAGTNSPIRTRTIN